MQKGFNTDFSAHGKNYHIQTEDWGEKNPFIVSRVFCNGAVLKTVKTPYHEALKAGPVQEQRALGLALRQQHQRILDEISSGKIK